MVNNNDWQTADISNGYSSFDISGFKIFQMKAAGAQQFGTVLKHPAPQMFWEQTIEIPPL